MHEAEIRQALATPLGYRTTEQCRLLAYYSEGRLDKYRPVEEMWGDLWKEPEPESDGDQYVFDFDM